MNLSRTIIGIALTLAIALLALVLAGERVRGITLNTLQLCICVVVLAVPVGTLLAVLLAKTNLPGRRAMLALFAVLLFVPLYLHAAAWQAALGVQGWLTPAGTGGGTWVWIDGWRGTIWIHVIAAIPWVVCIVAAAARRTDGDAEAAASLVVAPWRVLWSITLPRLAPAMAIAGLWTALGVAVEMTVTDFFQIRTFAEEVYTAAALGGFQTDNPARDYAPQSAWVATTGLLAGSLVLAALTLGVLMAVARFLQSLCVRHRVPAWRWQPRTGRWLLALVPLATLVAMLGLPVAALVYQAGLGTVPTADGWRRAWLVSELGAELAKAPTSHDREAWQSLVLGIGVATTATCGGIVLGWWWRTARRLPLGLLAVLAGALAVPGPVLAVMVIRLLNQPVDSPLWWLAEFYDSLGAPWLVQTIRLTPLATLAMAAGFAGLSSTLLEAARVQGIGWWQQLVALALPLSSRMMLVTWLAMFALSVGELAATILVMPPGRPTLAIHLFQLLHYGVEDQVSAVALWLFGVLIAMAMMVVLIFSSKLTKAISP